MFLWVNGIKKWVNGNFTFSLFPDFSLFFATEKGLERVKMKICC